MMDDTESLFSPQAYIDDILKGAGFAKTEDQEKLQTQLRAAAERDKAMAGKIKRHFSTKLGREILEWMVDLTLRKATITREMILTMDAKQLLLFAAHREGENQFTEIVLEAMAQSTGKKRKKRTPT